MNRNRRGRRRAAAVAVALALLANVGMPPAATHPVLLRSQPGQCARVVEPPDVVILEFSEPVTTIEVAVTGPEGREVARGVSEQADRTVRQGVGRFPRRALHGALPGDLPRWPHRRRRGDLRLRRRGRGAPAGPSRAGRPLAARQPRRGRTRRRPTASASPVAFAAPGRRSRHRHRGRCAGVPRHPDASRRPLTWTRKAYGWGTPDSASVSQLSPPSVLRSTSCP